MKRRCQILVASALTIIVAVGLVGCDSGKASDNFRAHMEAFLGSYFMDTFGWSDSNGLFYEDTVFEGVILKDAAPHHVVTRALAEVESYAGRYAYTDSPGFVPMGVIADGVPICARAHNSAHMLSLRKWLAERGDRLTGEWTCDPWPALSNDDDGWEAFVADTEKAAEFSKTGGQLPLSSVGMSFRSPAGFTDIHVEGEWTDFSPVTPNVITAVNEEVSVPTVRVVSSRATIVIDQTTRLDELSGIARAAAQNDVDVELMIRDQDDAYGMLADDLRLIDGVVGVTAGEPDETINVIAPSAQDGLLESVADVVASAEPLPKEVVRVDVLIAQPPGSTYDPGTGFTYSIPIGADVPHVAAADQLAQHPALVWAEWRESDAPSASLDLRVQGELDSPLLHNLKSFLPSGTRLTITTDAGARGNAFELRVAPTITPAEVSGETDPDRVAEFVEAWN